MMKIKKITDRIRRDFWAIYECEHCGHETKEKSGYDDDYFHSAVIPAMKCEKCGKTAAKNYSPRSTKYPAYMAV
jgi:transcription elongation factor Elf1